MRQTFSQTLLKWYDDNRRALPWRGERDPYRVWLSEIMLQQTRTETVERYYAAFLARFPTVRDLAAADEETVLKLWEGMGYYSRARNLHKAAKRVADDLGGRFPETAAGLRALPGVGPYAAGAIASIAFGEAVPALDGNQARVISRVTACDRVLRTPGALEPEARRLLDADRPGDYNQALMDLGATICLPRRPKCGLCPVAGFCEGRAGGDPEDYPRLPPPPVKREEARTIALVWLEGRVLVRKRPEKGLLAGLWEFPNLEGALQGQELTEALAGLGIAGARVQGPLPPAKHVFTHLIWHMTGWALTAERAGEAWRAVDGQELAALAMTSALRIYRGIAAQALSER